MNIPERPPKIEDNEIDDLFKYLTNESFNQFIKEANIKYYYWSDFKYKFNSSQISGKKKLVYYRAENFDGILSKLIAEAKSKTPIT